MIAARLGHLLLYELLKFTLIFVILYARIGKSLSQFVWLDSSLLIIFLV